MYLVLAVGVAVLGLGYVTKVLADSESNGSSRWVELSSVLGAALFIVALGVLMLA